MKALFCGALYVAFACTILSAQPVDTARKSSLLVVPIVYFTPETSWAFGAAGVYTQPSKGPGLPASQLQLGWAYTLRNQWLLYAPFNIYRNQWWFSGELGAYRYTYRFFGIGPNADPQYETYQVAYPRIRGGARYRLQEDWYAGIRYSGDYYVMQQFADQSALLRDQVTGIAGGFVSGAGVTITHDGRNALFYPTEGHFFNSHYLHFGKWVGSRYTYHQWQGDLRLYTTLAPSTVLAAAWHWQGQWGKVPFNMLSQMGGNKRMRGIFEGRFRDKWVSQWQVALRQTISKRWGAAIFGGLGITGPSLVSAFSSRWQWSTGAGLRWQLDPTRHLNLRLDGAISRDDAAVYFTVGEAF